MIRLMLSVALLGFTNLFATPAKADENLFAYSYGSETLPKGGSEAYLWATNRSDKGDGDYNAQDYKIELEHGFTNRIQGSLYLNFLSIHADGVSPVIEDVDRDFAWNGMQASVKYAFLSPYQDALGVAVYLEPGFARYSGNDGEREEQRSLEAKLLLQKNFAGDRLIWVGNITGEQEWAREVGGDEWEKEFEFDLSSGLGYQIGKGLHIGGEGRYSSVYEHGKREHWALFAGPTVHYAAKKWWGTLSFQQELDGKSGALSSSLDLDKFTKREVRLKLGYNF
ncbi:MAG: DUF6662 family protein [Sphingomicrobium sp.]